MRISDWSSDVCSSDLFQIAESDEAQRVTRRADFLEYLETTLQLRTIIVTERPIGCEFHLFRAEMEFMLNGRGWRITDVVHRSEYKGVEQHARKEDADEGSNNANHFSVSPYGSLSNRRGLERQNKQLNS